MEVIDLSKPNAVELLAASNFPGLRRIADHWSARRELEITTSGSTGPPRKVTLPFPLLEWSCRNSKLALHQRFDERVYCCLPLDKTGGAMQIIRCLINGWEAGVEHAAADPMIRLQSDHPFSSVSLTPFMASRIFENDQSVNKLKRFRTILLGGGVVGPNLRSRIIDFAGQGRRVFHTYGMTELAGHVALHEFTVDSPNTFRLLDGVEIEPNASGSATIRIPEIDVEVETTDRLEVSSRKIRFLGRTDLTINSGGLKLQPEEIEQKISEAGVLSQRFFVAGVPDEELGERVVLIIEGEKGPEEGEFLEKLHKGLSKAERPVRLMYVDRFVMTGSDKVDRIATIKKIKVKPMGATE